MNNAECDMYVTLGNRGIGLKVMRLFVVDETVEIGVNYVTSMCAARDRRHRTSMSRASF